MNESYIHVWPKFHIGQNVLCVTLEGQFKVSRVNTIRVIRNAGGEKLVYDLDKYDTPYTEDEICSIEYSHDVLDFILKWANEWGQMKKEEDAKECQATQ